MKFHPALLTIFAVVPAFRPGTPSALGAPTQGPQQILLKRSDLTLDHYQPQHLSTRQLYELAGELAARWFYLSDSGSGDAIQSLRVVGNSLMLYDTREEVERMKQFLAQVDVSGPVSQAEEEPPTLSVEYMPRFLSLETVGMLVERHVLVSVIEERGVTLFEGHPKDIAAAQETLKKLDVAPRQVFLTCELIEVDGPSAGIALTKELSDHLQKLLPGRKMAQVGVAMLRTSVGARKRISLRIETEARAYSLGLTPVAYDGETRALTVENCVLMPEGGEMLFDTGVVLRADEHTVLAATGASPLLLVVRVTPQ